MIADVVDRMRRIGLPMERLSTTADLRDALGGFLTPRRHQFTPALVDVGASDRSATQEKYSLSAGFDF